MTADAGRTNINDDKVVFGLLEPERVQTKHQLSAVRVEH